MRILKFIILPVLFLAFTYGGNAWSQDTKKKKEKTEKKNDGKVKQDIDEGWDKTKEGTEKAWDKTKEGTEKGWDKTKEGTKKGWDKTKEGTKKGAEETKEFFKGDDKKDKKKGDKK